MHEDLWAGVDLKIDHAEFFLERMVRALEPPERTQINVAIQASRASIATGWQRAIYAYLDAFLTMARCVPEVVNACFGADKVSPAMKDWFAKLPSDEQERRKEFTTKFRPAREGFRELALTEARNISVHRTGFAPVLVKLTGRFGVTHLGSPVARVPDAESRLIVAGEDPAACWEATLPPAPMEPASRDFTIDGKLLFPECQGYLDECRKLVANAREIAVQVHGDDGLTRPPS